MKAIIILYVRDQAKSRALYQAILDREPQLDVPGMTEFSLNADTTLGLMPGANLAGIVGKELGNPDTVDAPRAEVYLYVDNPQQRLECALKHGAQPLDDAKPRNWGDTAAYCMDYDCNVIAFAAKR